MLNKNNSLSDSQTFTNIRLGITLTYDTHLEGIFLQGCDLDSTIENIIRVHPVSGSVNRRSTSIVFPAFLVVRPGNTELVVLLNSSSKGEQTRRKVRHIERSAAMRGWITNVFLPKDSATGRAYRKIDKKRAGN